jgi:hypothetical protein
MLKYSDNWGGLTAENKSYYEDKYERFVPFSGKANTVGGEIVRAISRICYRFYNDGDTVYRYYGSSLNYSYACDAFLEGKVPGYETLRNRYTDEDFEEALAKNFNHIISWLMENEWVFTRENTQDCLDNAPKAEYPEEEYDSWDDED